MEAAETGSPDPARIQDIYSGKILSWRLSEAETWDVVRACIGDMLEDHDIPKHFYMDNGRAFASNAISGGAKHRNRFRKKKADPKNKTVNRFGIDEEEVAGILKNFGIEPHFTRPYAGQSKPIERAWKDLAEGDLQASGHGRRLYRQQAGRQARELPRTGDPARCPAGACGERIAEHNARPGRRSETAKGRSFDQTFEESIAHPGTILTGRRQRSAISGCWPRRWFRSGQTEAKSTTSRTSTGLTALTRWSGKKVKIRFDPDRLHDPIKVYEPNGRLICEAPCTAKGRFNDVEAATSTIATAGFRQAAEGNSGPAPDAQRR